MEEKVHSNIQRQNKYKKFHELTYYFFYIYKKNRKKKSFYFWDMEFDQFFWVSIINETHHPKCPKCLNYQMDHFCFYYEIIKMKTHISNKTANFLKMPFLFRYLIIFSPFGTVYAWTEGLLWLNVCSDQSRFSDKQITLRSLEKGWCWLSFIEKKKNKNE